MATRESVRPGGRSARVQQAVHTAVRELQAERSREDLTIPVIAAHAGVTPSTIYRRWGNLNDLLADVTLERFRPETAPEDTGALASDLLSWGEHYLDEMVSAPGRQMLCEIMASADETRRQRCFQYAREQIAQIHQRAVTRGETPPDVDTLMDFIIGPLIYRVLYDSDSATPERLREWVSRALGGV
ncbi:TetR/AcrR family transcriptional regulator [Arhodomonas sp. KWT2]|uniref:TetR/AcrR family transcriptional regulator n=1 Tax=unclassified Arhodomonas TaxID=2621637 RepID=UPI0013D6153E|nr:TetR/AcrR family transcriptional regulator [Arhodomonas sp. KWT]